MGCRIYAEETRKNSASALFARVRPRANPAFGRQPGYVAVLQASAERVFAYAECLGDFALAKVPGPPESILLLTIPHGSNRLGETWFEVCADLVLREFCSSALVRLVALQQLTSRLVQLVELGSVPLGIERSRAIGHRLIAFSGVEGIPPKAQSRARNRGLDNESAEVNKHPLWPDERAGK
jgi:hypothetical protein